MAISARASQVGALHGTRSTLTDSLALFDAQDRLKSLSMLSTRHLDRLLRLEVFLHLIEDALSAQL